MFFEFFENLRSKPKEARKRFAFLFSSVFTALVILLWGITILLTSFGARGTKQEAKNETKEPETTKTMFEKANSFLNDTQGASELVEQDWTKELENLDENVQAPLRTASSTILQTSTSTASTTENQEVMTAPVSEFEY